MGNMAAYGSIYTQQYGYQHYWDVTFLRKSWFPPMHVLRRPETYIEVNNIKAKGGEQQRHELR